MSLRKSKNTEGDVQVAALLTAVGPGAKKVFKT